MEAVDERTVRFTFQEGKASLSNERTILKQYVTASANYAELAEQARAVVADGKTSEDQEWIDLATVIAEYKPEELIASGPFTYSLDDVGEAFMTLHWQPNSLYSDSVQFGEIKLWAGETEVSTPLVLSGEIAYATNVYPPATLQAFVDEGIRLVSVPLGYGPGLYFNFANPVFQDVNLRKAVAHAINGEQSALLTNGLGASKITYYSGILDALTPALLSEEGVAALDQYGYDLAKAEEYMAAAGYSRNADGKWADANGNTLTFEYTFPADFADFSAAARDATAQLNDFGWDITERALPWQEAAQAIREGNYDLTVWSWGSGTPFAYNNFRSAILRWTTELAEGLPGWGLDLEFEYDGEMINLQELILNSSSTLDTDELLARADFVAKVINDTMFYVPLNEMLSVMPLNESLIAGAPADGDPIYANPASSGGDLFIVPLFLDGTLRPAG
ncbi:MAG: hypothetical protein IPK19_17625 [Chloroflexi bacterium]|nr:hypothetical protein [Chloroflexota bacterium]